MANNTNLGILAQVSEAQAMAFSFPHQATALGNKQNEYELSQLYITENIEVRQKYVYYY